MPKNPFALVGLSEGDRNEEYLISYGDETPKEELEKIAIAMMRLFLPLKPEEEPLKFFEGILDGGCVCAIRPKMVLKSQRLVETEKEQQLKFWLNPVLGLRVDIKNIEPQDFSTIFHCAAAACSTN